MAGLGPVLNLIRQHPQLAEPLLVAGIAKPPTADEFLAMVEYEDVDDMHINFSRSMFVQNVSNLIFFFNKRCLKEISLLVTQDLICRSVLFSTPYFFPY